MKRMLAMMLAVCMLLSTVAAATETETGNKIKDDSVSDMLNVGNPLTGEETPPFIAAADEPILLNKENELLLYTSNRYGKDGTAAVDDFFHTYEKMGISTSYKTSDTANSSAPAPALDLSFVTAVALDATGSGRDDHVAYLGVKDYDSGDTNKPDYDKELRLVLYNARTRTTVDMIRLGDVSSWIGDVKQWAYKTFFSVTAGDYDGDGVDEIACTDANMGVQMIEIGSDSSSNLKMAKSKSYTWQQLVPASVVDKMSVKAGSLITRRALISLATGNLDGTGAEELAVAVSSNHPDPEYGFYLPAVPEAYSTSVAVLMAPLANDTDPAKKTHTISICSVDYGTDEEEQQKPLYRHILYAGQITAGDVNGDHKDEIVVAGYPGTIKVDENDTIVDGRYELDGYDDEYKIGICYATLDGNELIHYAITEDAMTPFINEGFFASNPLLAPLSLDAAKLHGQYGKESVFVGGKIYQLTTVEDETGTEVEQFGALYTVDFFKDESSAGYTDAYVEHVTSGIFAGPEPFTNQETGDVAVSSTAMINEQFVFTVVEKDNSQNDYSYKVGFVCMNTDENSGTVPGSGSTNQLSSGFYDNTVKMNSDGHLLDELDGGVEENYGTAMVPVAVDVDNDGIPVKYVGTKYYYEDPSVAAVLQAAPYFDELGSWTDEFSGSTTYSTTVSRSLIDIWGHSISVHAGIKGKWGNDITGELEVKVGYALDVDKQHELAYTTAYTTTFTAGPHDTVVVQRTPYACYEYVRVDESGNVLPETDEAKGGSVFFMEAMHPVYVQLSVDEYNQFVDEYNAMADRHDNEGKDANGNAVKTVGDSYRLVKITEDILPVNTTGNPANYFSSIRDGQYISQGMYALGYNGGYTASEFAQGIEKSFTQVNAHGAHIEAEGVAPSPFGFSVGAFAETAFQDTAGWGDATLNETATGGEVANINPGNYTADEQQTLSKYGFNWRCALWKKSLMTKPDGTAFRDAEGNEILVPIVGYVVTNVRSPMAAPTGVEAYLSGKGNQVTVEWNRSPDAEGTLRGYSVYRYYDNREPELVNETMLDPDTTSFVDTEQLRAGKIYTYYLVAHYDSVNGGYKTMNSQTSSVVWGIPIVSPDEEEKECTNHIVVIDRAVAPDCVNIGLTTGKHCRICGKIIVMQEEIPATGEHIFGEYQSIDGNLERAECIYDCGTVSIRVAERDTGDGSDTPANPKKGEASVGKELLQELAETGQPVYLNNSIMSMEFNNAAMSQMAQLHAETGVSIVVEDITSDEAEDRLVFDIHLAVDDEKQTYTDFGAGEVTVTIPLPEAMEVPDGKKAAVKYVPDEGEPVDMNGTYDRTGNTVKFTTNHFSTYTVLIEDCLEHIYGEDDTCTICGTMKPVAPPDEPEGPGAVAGSVGGIITSAGSASEPITVQLVAADTGEVVCEMIVSGNSAAYLFEDVAAGSYKLKVSKKAHMLYEETVTVTGEQGLVKDVTLHLGSNGERFRIAAIGLTLSELIDVRYSTTVPAGFENPCMEFTFNGRKTTVAEYTIESGRYVFRFLGVNPQEMGDNISATLHATYEGTPVSYTYDTYSVRTYCVNQLNRNISPEFRTLLSDLLVYGEQTQRYRNYKTNDLVTAGLELTPSTFLTLDDTYNKQALTGTKDPNAAWVAVGLTLSSSMQLRLAVRVDDPTAYTYEVKIANRTTTFTKDDLRTNPNTQRTELLFNNINASEFDKPITAVIKKDGVQVGQMLTYSVNTYIQKYQDDATLGDLLKAIYNYGASTENYNKNR